MITLAIDTSTPRGAVAVLHDDQPIAEAKFERDGLFDAIVKLNPGNFDLIVVGTGPGSFTGIRAGIAAAKGLALPRSVPLKAVSSFDAIALTAAPRIPRDCGQMCVFGDARREEIYFTLYDQQGQPKGPCQIGTFDTIADELHFPFWFVSSEMARYESAVREVFGGFATICETPVFPSAAALGWLGRQKFLADNKQGDAQIEPIYLRETVYKKI